MHILVSNDDGYEAPGIVQLAQQMRRFGQVTVVAPEHNHSGASNALSLRKSIAVQHPSPDLYIVSGTPSDCVHLALTGMLDTHPDLIVSGINCGANMGDDTIYSGTVAVATEGYIFGIDSISFSQIDSGWVELDSAARMAGVIVERFLERKHEPIPVLLNVNLPNLPFERMSGIRTTRLGRRHNACRAIKESNQSGLQSYRIGSAGLPRVATDDTDFWATEHGFVSVTPLQIDLTQHTLLKQTKSWVE